MEQQTTLLIEIFQKTIENLVQYLVTVFNQTDLQKSPNRKRQMINLVPPTNNPMQWETFLKTNDRLSLHNKIFFRTHRNNRSGAGLLIGIPTNMSGRVIFENSQDPNLDLLAVEIQSHNFPFTIVNIYAPHGFDIKQVQKFFSNLKVNFYFGDFNLHHPFWGEKHLHQKAKTFGLVESVEFSILNTSMPTHIAHNFTSSIIDLTLCSAALLNEVYCYVSECTFESDHLPIVVSWPKLTNASKYLKTIYWNPILRDSNKFLQSIDDPTVEIVTDKISCTININTKNKILPNNDYPPWWDIACNNFCHVKKIMWKKARNSVSIPDLIRYKKYRTFPTLMNNFRMPPRSKKSPAMKSTSRKRKAKEMEEFPDIPSHSFLSDRAHSMSSNPNLSTSFNSGETSTPDLPNCLRSRTLSSPSFSANDHIAKATQLAAKLKENSKLVKIIDCAILLDIINHSPYTKTAEFYSDVKFIHHNAAIVYGVDSDEAKSALLLEKDFRKEILDLEACPECYRNIYCSEDESTINPFLKLCNPPHDIIWAQLKGYPYWPAKCLKVIKGVAHVKFFGKHEQ
ncbi:zinc finger MYND domain-containing protein 11 [Caerostris extrusa]|uniref:Zinc finger MYND domain-containing protein 11 n=1 Tax=Caerostris extrusa TaxID=172846 RepID=A0AAV4UT17_CAEEX|nr:zinc finger MYND domain-containing protein 11 [Caerostris extrusa]